MVDPHSPTATKIYDSTRQHSAVAAAFPFFSTFVCKSSKRSGVFQDSQIRVNLNKDVRTLPSSSKPKQSHQGRSNTYGSILVGIHSNDKNPKYLH